MTRSIRSEIYKLLNRYHVKVSVFHLDWNTLKYKLFIKLFLDNNIVHSVVQHKYSLRTAKATKNTLRYNSFKCFYLISITLT